MRAARQFSFRLPGSLVDQVEARMEALREAGLEVNRADVVRMLLKHALDATHDQLDLLLGGKSREPVKPRD